MGDRPRMAAVQQTGSLGRRVRHVGDATSLRDAKNTDRYLAGSTPSPVPSGLIVCSAHLLAKPGTRFV
jgi:hypothetical protein